jgi:hypothetical protein
MREGEGRTEKIVRKTSRNHVASMMSRGKIGHEQKQRQENIVLCTAVDPDFFLLIAPKSAGGIAARRARHAIHDSDKPWCMA